MSLFDATFDKVAKECGYDFTKDSSVKLIRFTKMFSDQLMAEKDARIEKLEAHNWTDAQAKIVELEKRVEELEWENKGIAEWRDVALRSLKLLKENNVPLSGELAFFAQSL